MYQPIYKNNRVYGDEALLRASLDGEYKFPVSLYNKNCQDNKFDYFIINSVLSDLENDQSSIFNNKVISINISSYFISNIIDFDLIDFLE